MNIESDKASKKSNSDGATGSKSKNKNYEII